jgi:hypothetical protein
VVVAVVGAILLVLCLAVVVGIARDTGPGPDDVAVSYEHAWDRLDFEALWTLSASELRDGLDHRAFVAAKRAAYAERGHLAGLAAGIVAEDSTRRANNAVVTTRVGLRDGTVVHNTVQLVRRSSRWQVVAYEMVPAADGAVVPRPGDPAAG